MAEPLENQPPGSKSLLLDMLPELRINIYHRLIDHLDASELWARFFIGDSQVFNSLRTDPPPTEHTEARPQGRRPRTRWRRADVVTGLLMACRQINTELSHELINFRTHTTLLLSGRDNSSFKYNTLLGDIATLKCWEVIRNIHLDVALAERGSQVFNPKILLHRVRSVLAALKHGTNLRSLEIRLCWGDDASVPRCLDNVTYELGLLSVPNDCSVVVRTDEQDEDEENDSLGAALERAIQLPMMAGRNPGQGGAMEDLGLNPEWRFFW